MICPHCSTTVVLDVKREGIYSCGFHNENKGYLIQHAVCPSCCNPVIELTIGNTSFALDNHSRFTNSDFEIDELLYPKNDPNQLVDEVPLRIRDDFYEAKKVIGSSPKASAALSRRLLQSILHDEFSIKKRNLSEEIDVFINLKDVPSHLSDAVDAIRNVGNFAAHPSKNTNTGEIVEVEEGEAEWLLEVLEVLFDFTFVQPKRLEKRKNELNEKLKSIGKPPMKGK